MNKISRRRFVTAGLATTAGISGVAIATSLANRYGLVPPDSGGIFGPGATLTYAAHRLFSRNLLAREFPRSKISTTPFANSIAPLSDDFIRLQSGGFADWHLSVQGLVAQPATLSLSDLRNFPVRSQVTEVVCEEGWSYIAEWIGTPLHDLEIRWKRRERIPTPPSKLTQRTNRGTAKRESVQPANTDRRTNNERMVRLSPIP